MSGPLRNIKKAQKESLLFREISRLFMQTAMDDTRLQGVILSRVSLSVDKGVCYIYFYSYKGKKHFDEVLEVLKLYKPSLRKALSKLPSRYTPELVFKYDEDLEKQMKLEEILDKVKEQDVEQE
ncbi:30S ribosome-binding factor RbfA [Candidatus Dependentiae bacterium]|nr:30S ribosome-binding factor RbfA [Candidatus Dependentiae bacterium]